jgi:hypothetical protein
VRLCTFQSIWQYIFLCSGQSCINYVNIYKYVQMPCVKRFVWAINSTYWLWVIWCESKMLAHVLHIVASRVERYATKVVCLEICTLQFVRRCVPNRAVTVIPRLTKIIRSGITFVSRNAISHRLSGVPLLAVWNVNNPVVLVGLPCVMWSAHFFVTHITQPDRSYLLLYVSARIH